MSGNDLLLDTNAVLHLLASNQIVKLLRKKALSVSVITEMELLSYPLIKKEEEQNIQSFLSHITIIGLTEIVKENTIHLRKKYKLKLPDAIIAATALSFNLILFTNDKGLFKINEIKVQELLEHTIKKKK